jgi:hypothetical protein
MDVKTSFRFLRWLLIALAVCLGGVQGFAQTKAAQTKKSPAPLQTQSSPRWIKDPNNVMPMRQMTKAERRAAAQRSQARRVKANAQRKQTAPSSQGVQQ